MLGKLKETFFSIIPIAALVLLLHLTVCPLGELFPNFLVGSLFLFLGLSLFSFGADIALVPFGERMGSALVQKRNIPLLLAVGFLLGFIITVAEPDVQVLADQVVNANPRISKLLFVALIGLSVGVFLDVGFIRTLKATPLKWVFFTGYAAVFILAFIVDGSMIPVSFDAGGSTTGPMTVPVILALGLGVSKIVSTSEEDGGFGYVGIASIGPIMFVLLMALFTGGGSGGELGSDSAIRLSAAFADCSKETAIAIVPLVVLFCLFQPLFFKGTRRWVRRILFGFLYTFMGVTLFLTGVKYGYLQIGRFIGSMLAKDGRYVLISVLGFAIGALIVFVEPSVRVLVHQVESASAGRIKPRLVYIFLAVGVGLSVSLSMLRALFGISIWYFIVPGYAIAVGLSFICPELFTGIAFDSGGVASGPMSTSFVLSLAIGVSLGAGTDPLSDAFGLVGLIAMMPIVTVQLLGIIVKIKEKTHEIPAR